MTNVPASKWFVPTALLVISMGLGVVISTWARPSCSDEPKIEVAAFDTRTAEALIELRRAIEKLPDQMRSMLESHLNDGLRRPVGANGADAAQLDLLAQKLQQLLARVDASLASLPVTTDARLQPWQGPGYLTFETMRSTLEELRRQERAGHVDLRIDEQLTKAHMLWTREDALRRYGPPNRIDTGHGYGLVYDQFPIKFDNETCWVEIWTSEGLVSSVHVQCKDDS